MERRGGGRSRKGLRVIDVEKILPKMFHRRLALLMSFVLAVCAVLAAQVTRLTVIDGSRLRAVAESRLVDRELLATTRGRILDRHGEALAIDAASYDVAVDYEVISGAWVIEQAAASARARFGARWAELGPDAREEALLREREAFDHRVEELWDVVASLGGVDRDELERRLGGIRREIGLMAAEHNTRRHALERAKFEDGEVKGFEHQPIREQTQPHVVLPRVPDEVAFEFKRLEGVLPGLRVIDSWRREYPWHTVRVRLDRSSLPMPLRMNDEVEIEVVGLADHIIGSMRERVYAEDVERLPFRTGRGASDIDLQGYLPGDAAGASGIERAFETHLRGRRGMVWKHINTGAEERVARTSGSDLRLTLDIHLQARVQAILTPSFGLARTQQFHSGWDHGAAKPTQLPVGSPLKGAAVVMDVDTGEILAMVTMPTIAIGSSWSEARRAIEHPFVNRAVETPYPPGSIIKPLVLAAAVAEGVHPLDEGIVCTGHFYPNWKDRARCWIYREVHGLTTHSAQLGDRPLDAVQALARSCNIYFYTLADELGADRLVRWYREFGIGRTFDVGLARRVMLESGRLVTAGENPGSLPSEESLAALRESGALDFETIILGIGQGQVTWTPLHAANAYATLARGGYIRDASLILNDPRSEVNRREGDLGLDPRVVDAVLEGLRQSITETYGTGYGIRYDDNSVEDIINAPGVTVWAKTGTAQAPPYPLDEDADGVPERRIDGLDHAWFVGLVGGGDAPHRPRYSIAVILEYGGSGGRAAGPIANQIIHALLTEGYL